MQGMIPAAVIGTMLLVPATASAFGFGLLRPRPTTVAYYYYPPVVYAPMVQLVPVQPWFGAIEPPLAIPTAAPPSSGPVAPWNVPPPAPKGPQVKESQSYYSSAVARRDADAPLASQVPVAFWNRTSRTVTLKIDSQTRVLASGKGLTLDLPRQFVWQADGRGSQTERVPANAPAYEIVIQQ